MNWSNARILFHRITQLLDGVYLNPKYNNIFFSAIPTIDVNTTQDNIKVKCWHKKPNELLQHQIAHLIK
jgi:hypothetical protein